jgi:hypothetical protein
MEECLSVEIPEELIASVRARKCILFVGSGLSSMAGYPTWAQLIELLVDRAKRSPRARLEGLEAMIERRDYFMLAEFARETLGPSMYTQILRRELDRPVPSSPVHRLIAETDYRGIITTNYDRLLETTITKVRDWSPVSFTTEGITAMGDALFNPDLFIYKLHGDIVSGSIVLSSRDYDRMILRNPHVRSFLFGAVLSHTLLFAGYSLRDPDFDLILRELTLVFENYVPDHYALLPNPGAFEMDHLLRRMNIHAIPYDPADNHREAAEVLRVLHDAAPVALPLAA